MLSRRLQPDGWPLKSTVSKWGMTICIAAICANRTAVVVASDRMLSAPFLTLEFDHPDAKIDQLSRSCVGLTAGDALVATDLYAGSAGLANQLQDPQIQMIADEVKRRFVKIRKSQINERVFQPRGLSIDDFYLKGMIQHIPPDLAMLLDSQIQQGRLEASVIVAGVDGSGAHIYGIEDPGTSACYDRLGYHATGSGHRHALLSLVSAQQHWTLGINETVHNVFEAKKQAELAQGVGVATEMHIVTISGIRVLTPSDISDLGAIRDRKMAPEMDEVKAAIEALPFEKDVGDDR